jgi:predicted GNAT superfamily acetyltransferase
MPLHCSLHSPDTSAWPHLIDEALHLLGAPTNPTLFPPHFLKATFARIGGRVVLVEHEQQRVAIGFLFPRDRTATHPEYTLRCHTLQSPLPDPTEITRQVEALLGSARVHFYDPSAPQHYPATHHIHHDLDIGHPTQAEAHLIPHLQQAIWGGDPSDLYPPDIHSAGFHLGTSLVARLGGEVVGFNFGFYRFGGPGQRTWPDARYRTDLAIESQVLGVRPEVRSRSLGVTLKRIQAEQSLAQGINLIHWTVDPLQFANAVLNFEKLRAVAFQFYPNYYSFRNDLNRVSPSRFGITWFLATQRVQNVLRSPTNHHAPELSTLGPVQRLDLAALAAAQPPTAPLVAIEVPSNWTALQRDDLPAALRWRELTDRFFENHLALEAGKYVITGAALAGDQRYLIARRFEGGMSVFDQDWL